MAQKTVVLTFDDCCKSHLHFVVPLLQKYGFNATFFICRPEKWLSEQPEAYLTDEEIVKIAELGFEIGNHSMNHPGMRELSDEECRNELRSLNAYFEKIGIPAPVSFAYPGGPYAANAAKILPEFGLRWARTTEHKIWDLRQIDPMRLPCFSVTENNESDFYTAVNLAEESDCCAPVLLYHGVPDIHHPWCNTPEEMFAVHMKYLAENNFRVISMRQFANG